MPDAPTPLDLDAIEADIAWCRTYGLGMYQADRLAHEHAPALVEEVKRLRADVARLEEDLSDRTMDLAEMTHPDRPAPAWDEDAIVDRMARVVSPRLFAAHHSPFRAFGETRSSDELREHEREIERVKMRDALAVVRERLPVKPDRETVALKFCLAQDSTEHMEQTDDAPCSRCLAWADAVLDLWPGRSEAEVKAEALREAADWLAHEYGNDGFPGPELRARADRLAAEGGADRG